MLPASTLPVILAFLLLPPSPTTQVRWCTSALMFFAACSPLFLCRAPPFSAYCPSRQPELLSWGCSLVPGPQPYSRLIWAFVVLADRFSCATLFLSRLVPLVPLFWCPVFWLSRSEPQWVPQWVPPSSAFLPIPACDHTALFTRPRDLSFWAHYAAVFLWCSLYRWPCAMLLLCWLMHRRDCSTKLLTALPVPLPSFLVCQSHRCLCSLITIICVADRL